MDYQCLGDVFRLNKVPPRTPQLCEIKEQYVRFSLRTSRHWCPRRHGWANHLTIYDVCMSPGSPLLVDWMKDLQHHSQVYGICVGIEICANVKELKAWIPKGERQYLYCSPPNREKKTSQATPSEIDKEIIVTLDGTRVQIRCTADGKLLLDNRAIFNKFASSL